MVSSGLEIDRWMSAGSDLQDVIQQTVTSRIEKVQALSGLLPVSNSHQNTIVQTLSGLFDPIQVSQKLRHVIAGVSWSHHSTILTCCETAPERYFYMKLAASERWSVRELRRQIDSILFTRYTTARNDPGKCLPAAPEAGDLLPFRDHYILEFLGLSEQHSEKELRRAILANLRDFFLEFGRDLAFVGEEYPLTIGNDTFSIDLVFYHRRLQCLSPDIQEQSPDRTALAARGVEDIYRATRLMVGNPPLHKLNFSPARAV
jgi:predicted nuclease of restriction endonuclease-like (RecB) superfamily